MTQFSLREKVNLTNLGANLQPVSHSKKPSFILPAQNRRQFIIHTGAKTKLWQADGKPFQQGQFSDYQLKLA